jgi:serine O-acetyltransferase
MKLLLFLGQIFYWPHLVLFLLSKNKEIIVLDLYAQKSNKGVALLYDLSFELLTNKYFRTLFYFRTPGLISKILRVFYPKHSSFTIDINTKIESGLRLAHPYSTIINAQEIGSNLYINHLVTIGEKNGNKPIIGSNVEIHANAIIIGGITIGDNAIIGAGAVVVKDVPIGAIVVGNPAKVLYKH